MAFFVRFWVLILLAGIVALSVWAETGSETQVTVWPDGDVLVAEWQLPVPVDAFSFEDWAVAAPQRLEEWKLTNQDAYTFNGVELQREDGAAFDTFSMTVSPATDFYDRFYVPVIRIGETGWFLREAAFADKANKTMIRFEEIDPAHSLLVAGEVLAEGDPVSVSEKGFIYIGPDAFVDGNHAALTVISGPEIPGWLKQLMMENTLSVTALLSERIAVHPPAPPTLILSYKADWDNPSWKGGSLGRVLAIHLRDIDLREQDEAFRGQLRSLAMHEAVHIWIGQLYSSSENSEQSWLHEGAAEYIALRAAAAPDQFHGSMEGKINNCQRMLVRRSILSTPHVSRGRTPYECGALVQLIAEAASRHMGNGDILDIWKAVFERAGEGRIFDTAIFRAAASKTGGEAFTARMDALEAGMSAKEWKGFLTGLSDIGIDIGIIEPDSAASKEHRLAQLALGAVQRDYCNNRISMYSREDHYWINLEGHCGEALPGNPEIRTLNGVDVIEAPGDAYTEMRRACAADEPVVLGRLGGGSLDPLACGEWMSELTAPVRLEAMPAMPEL